MTTITNLKNCTSCAACMNICKTNAIKMNVNDKGFYYPEVYENKCVSCGLCENVCPQTKDKGTLIGEKNRKEPVCYAAWSKERENSSSGGVFFVFARYIIEQKGVVFGAAYDEKLHVHHIAVQTTDELEMLRKSKYVQSEVGYSYRDVKEYLDSGRKVLFSGCPCQVAALRSFLQKDYENLYLIDILCDSALPVGIYEKYIKDIESSHGKKIKKLDFRNKKFGWRCGSLSIEFNDETKEDIYEDLYMKGFMSGLYRSETCMDCNYAEIPRPGDITLGDFWKIQQYDSKLNDDKGTSLLMVNTPNGKELFENTIEEFEVLKKVDMEFTERHNRFFAKFLYNKKSERFWQLQKDHTIASSVTQSLNDQYDITIVGNWNTPNYGAQLTYFALYQCLTDRGYSVLMLERPDTPPYKPSSMPLLFNESPYPEYALSPKFHSLSEMTELNKRCSIFITGSDQLWNPLYFGRDMEFFTQSFVSDDNKKIAYATSFGKSELTCDKEFKNRMGFLLGRFQYHSVREAFGTNIMKNEFGLNAECVVDPVFLCDKHYYIQMAEKSELNIQEPYMFCYILKPDIEKLEVLKSISKYKKLRLVCVGDAPSVENLTEKDIDWLNRVKIEDWLYLIKNCSLMIADSFHALCFAIIFENQFISLTNYSVVKTQHERMEAILEVLSIKDRLFTYQKDISIMDNLFKIVDETVDYNCVNQKLNEVRLHSLKWLTDAIKSPMPENHFSFWGAYGHEILKLRDTIAEIKPMINKLNDKTLKEQNESKDFGHLKSKDGTIKIERKGQNMKNIVAFGAGGYFRRNQKKICEFANLEFVCDNSPEKWGQSYGDNVMCVSPDKIKELEDVFVLITVDNPAVATSLIIQLLEMGITAFDHADNRIFNN